MLSSRHEARLTTTRRAPRLGIAALLAVALLIQARLPAADAPARVLPVSAVASIGMTVSDMDRAVAFYRDVLTFEELSDIEVLGEPHERLDGLFGVRKRIVRLRLGDETIELTEYLTPRGRALPPDSRGNDRWFQHVAIIVPDMEAAYARLRAHRVAHASTAPQRLPAWNVNAAGIEAFYFRDPDGHFLEVLAFPPDKGLPKWHRQAAGRLFLGIDHTAIVVGDTERSLAFYRDTLGMDVVGGSENHGIEQEHLNNVFGARLRITTLRAPAGPGVELLEYLAPRDGREAPSDLRPNDITHWQTTVTSRGIGALLRAGRAFSLVSADVVRFADDRLGFDSALLVRDPDGHAVRVVEAPAADPGTRSSR